jgi:tripartite-type tricarboxylate transporter receptor subunit TctC
MFATAGTPPEIVERLNGIVNTALKDKAMADRLMVQGIVPKLMTVAEYTAFIGAETRKFRKVVADANIKLSN